MRDMKETLRKQDWLLLLLVSASGVLVRLYYHASFFGGGSLDALPFSDERSYYLAGAQLFSEQGWRYFLTPRSLWNGPLNVLWIAFLGRQIVLIKVMNLLLLAGVGVLAWDAARRLFSRSAAYTALLLVTIHPPFARFGPTLLSEPLFVFFTALGFWLVVSRFESRPGRGALLAGIVLGLGALVRPTLQLFPVALLLVWGALALRSRSLRGQLVLPLLLAAGFLLPVVPWALKNALVLDKVGLSNGLGAVLYLGSDLRVDGDEPVYSGMDFRTGEVTAPFTHLDTEGDRRLVHAAWQQVRAHPSDSARLFAKKPFRFLLGRPISYFSPHRDWLEYARRSPLRDLAYVSLEVVLVPLAALVGIAGILLLPGPGAVRVFAGALIAYFTLLHSVTFPIPRLALPIFPPLAVFAAGVITRTDDRRHLAPTIVAISFAVSLWMALSQRGADPGVASERDLQYFETVRRFDVDQGEPADLRRLWDGRFVSTGPDPRLVFSIPPLAVGTNQVVFLELTGDDPAATDASSRRANGHIFWRPEGGSFSEANSQPFRIVVDGERRLHRISPSLRPGWHGNISGFRLDFADNRPGVTYRVDRLEVRF